MKKIAAIWFLLLYLLSFSGVTVSSNYCCGRLASIKVHFTVGKCYSNKSKSCCNDVTHFIKVYDAQQATVSDISFNVPVLQLQAVLPVINAWAFIYCPNQAHNAFFFHSPPLRTTMPLFLQHAVFLI